MKHNIPPWTGAILLAIECKWQQIQKKKRIHKFTKSHILSQFLVKHTKHWIFAQYLIDSRILFDSNTNQFMV